MEPLSLGSIDTGRLYLRCPRIDDAPFLAEMMTPAISRWLASWPAPLSQEEVSARIIEAKAALLNRQAINLIIEVKADQVIIGWTKVARCEGNARRGDLSYWLGEAYHGLGYGVEAASAIMAVAFECLDLDVVEAGAQAENLASF